MSVERVLSEGDSSQRLVSCTCVRVGVLLFVADVNNSQPDKKSIMTYVMCLFQSLPYSGLEDASFDFSDSSSVASPLTEQPSTVCIIWLDAIVEE